MPILSADKESFRKIVMLIDSGKLVETAEAIHDLIVEIDQAM